MVLRLAGSEKAEAATLNVAMPKRTLGNILMNYYEWELGYLNGMGF
jgi:hypothetical protein